MKGNFMIKNFLFTSESVSEGHPDKLADQISDAILDAHLERDKDARVACETMITGNKVILAGEFMSCKTDESLPVRKIVKDVLKQAGYDDKRFGFDYDGFNLITDFRSQSGNIATGINRLDGHLGAGDQGLMFGYATDETPELMPMPVMLAHKLLMLHAELRKSGKYPFLGPDAKSVVTVQYENDVPRYVQNVVMSVQHTEDMDVNFIREFVTDTIIKKLIPPELMAKQIRLFINPAGPFIEGGPKADTGLTGRKIIVDTYGGMCPHGGGAFSGKDATKVDRSAAYMARYIAKNIVASGVAKKCLIQLSYAIGEAKPIAVYIDCFGTALDDENRMMEIIPRVFDLTPGGIISVLHLRRPVFRKTAAYGHFGRNDPDFYWERTDYAREIRDWCNLNEAGYSNTSHGGHYADN